MKMDPKESRATFNNLLLKEKAELLGYAFHILVTTSDDNKYDIHLYEISSQFVEVWYNNSTNQIDNIWMPSYRELNCHLTSISLEHLGLVF